MLVNDLPTILGFQEDERLAGRVLNDLATAGVFAVRIVGHDSKVAKDVDLQIPRFRLDL